MCLTSLQHHYPGRGLLDWLKDQPLYLWKLSPIGLVSFQNHSISGNPFHKFEWPRAYWGNRYICSQFLSGSWAHYCCCRVSHIRQHWSERFLGDYLHRVFVHDSNLLHEHSKHPSSRQRRDSKRNRLEVELYRLSIKGCAVMELNASSQKEGPSYSIFGNLPRSS